MSILKHLFLTSWSWFLELIFPLTKHLEDFLPCLMLPGTLGGQRGLRDSPTGKFLELPPSP